MTSVSTKHVHVLMECLKCRELAIGLRKKPGVEGSSKWYIALFVGPRRKDPHMNVPCPRAYCHFTLLAEEPANNFSVGK